MNKKCDYIFKPRKGHYLHMSFFVPEALIWKNHYWKTISMECFAIWCYISFLYFPFFYMDAFKNYEFSTLLLRKQDQS